MAHDETGSLSLGNLSMGIIVPTGDICCHFSGARRFRGEVWHFRSLRTAIPCDLCHSVCAISAADGNVRSLHGECISGRKHGVIL